MSSAFILPTYPCPHGPFITRGAVSHAAISMALEVLRRGRCEETPALVSHAPSVGGATVPSFYGTVAASQAITLELGTFVRHLFHASGEDPLRALLASPDDGGLGSALYLMQHALERASGGIAAGLLDALPREALVPVGARHRVTNLWACAGASRTSTHFDDDDNVLLLLAGRKRIAIASPSLCLHGGRDATPAGVPLPLAGASAEALLATFSAGSLAGDARHHAPRFDLFALHAASRSAAATASGDSAAPAGEASRVLTAVCDLSAGDALHLPAGWWHEVRSEPCTIAVNAWSHARSLAGVPFLDGEGASGLNGLDRPFVLRTQLAHAMEAGEQRALSAWRGACAHLLLATPLAISVGDARDDAVKLGGTLAAAAAAAERHEPAQRSRSTPALLDALALNAHPSALLRAFVSLVNGSAGGPVAAADGGGSVQPLLAVLLGLQMETVAALALAWEEAAAPAGDAAPADAGVEASRLASSAAAGEAALALRADFASLNAALASAPAAAALQSRVQSWIALSPEASGEGSALAEAAPLSAIIEASRLAVRSACLRALSGTRACLHKSGDPTA